MKRGFTLVEVLVAFFVFTIIIGIVLTLMVTLFNSFRRGERMVDTDQKQRVCLYKLGKEVSSLTKVVLPAVSFVGNQADFFFIFAQKDNLIGSKYVYHPENFTLEHYYQEPANYGTNTYQSKEICLEKLSNCQFMYYDGELWKDTWDATTEHVPRMIKIIFAYQNETKQREFVVNIPVSP